MRPRHELASRFARGGFPTPEAAGKKPETSLPLPIWANVRTFLRTCREFAKTLNEITTLRKQITHKQDISGHFWTSE
jgi:hypothetical protein